MLYCNPGYAMRIDGLPEAESDELLELPLPIRNRRSISTPIAGREGDVLMWDNIGTVHNAVADYRPNEPRYIRRVQVMATRDYARLVA